MFLTETTQKSIHVQVKPGPVEFEAENISLSSLNAVLPTGPPSDISDRCLFRAFSSWLGCKLSPFSQEIFQKIILIILFVFKMDIIFIIL